MRGGYANDPRLPIVGDTVIIENDKYNITSIEGDRVIANGISYDPDKLISFSERGGKRRKSKRKQKWDKETIAVVASTLVIDKSIDPLGGKKMKRKSNTRKKPYGLKKRIR